MPTYPVSIKGVVLDAAERVLLLRNERAEWELPGGRIELGESPEECVAREVFEETRWRVRAGPVLDTWVYHVTAAARPVFVVTYGCLAAGDVAPVLSHEHEEIGLFGPGEVGALPMPEGYRRSIAAWLADPRRPAGPPPT